MLLRKTKQKPYVSLGFRRRFAVASMSQVLGLRPASKRFFGDPECFSVETLGVWHPKILGGPPILRHSRNRLDWWPIIPGNWGSGAGNLMGVVQTCFRPSKDCQLTLMFC